MAGWEPRCQQSAAKWKLVRANAIGQETELTDAHQAGRKHVQQEATQELDRVEGHKFSTAAVGVVFPFETHAAVFKRAQAVVGNGDAVSIAGQIFQHAAWSAEGRFDVDHPVEVGRLIAESLEAGGFSECFELAVKL